MRDRRRVDQGSGGAPSGHVVHALGMAVTTATWLAAILLGSALFRPVAAEAAECGPQYCQNRPCGTYQCQLSNGETEVIVCPCPSPPPSPPAPTDDAGYVSDTFPSTMACGSSLGVEVTVQNSGTTDWQPGEHKLGAVDDDDPLADIRAPLGGVVSAGSTHTFSFNLHAPQAAGAYRTDWRMLREGVRWFGPTLVDKTIEVQCNPPEYADARVEQLILPDRMVARSTFAATIRLRNTGTRPWRIQTGEWLRGVGSAPAFGAEHLDVHPNETIDSDESWPFEFLLAAPAAAGTYTLRWQMIEDNARVFGPVIERTIEVDGEIDDAQFLGGEIYEPRDPGESWIQRLTFKNTGNTVWREGEYKLGVEGEGPQFIDGANRVQITGTVPKEYTYVFEFSMTAPTLPGSHVTRWRMVREGGAVARWFGQTLEKDIRVKDLDEGRITVFEINDYMKTGRQYGAFVKVKNTGQTTWFRNEYLLASTRDEGHITPRFLKSVTKDVGPDDFDDFVFFFPAPTRSDRYAADWNLVRWRDETTYTVTEPTRKDVEVLTCRSRVVAQNFPPCLRPGETYAASVTMQNTAPPGEEFTWLRGEGFRLRAFGDSDPFVPDPPDGNKPAVDMALRDRVHSGQFHTFEWEMRAPSGGTYVTDWQMVQEGMEWCGEVAQATVEVSEDCAGEAPDLEPTSPDVVRYIHSDPLGSVRLITDAGGRVVSRHDYFPYGEEIPPGNGRDPGDGYAASTSVKQRFTGKERDFESGLDFFEARYFSAPQGRFTTVDPGNAGAAPGDPQSWNGYSYALNNPLRYVDPTGLAAKCTGSLDEGGSCTTVSSNDPPAGWIASGEPVVLAVDTLDAAGAGTLAGSQFNLSVAGVELAEALDARDLAGAVKPALDVAEESIGLAEGLGVRVPARLATAAKGWNLGTLAWTFATEVWGPAVQTHGQLSLARFAGYMRPIGPLDGIADAVRRRREGEVASQGESVNQWLTANYDRPPDMALVQGGLGPTLGQYDTRVRRWEYVLVTP